MSYGADMGSVKIGTDDVSLFVDNDFGDGYFNVDISLKKIEPPKDMEYKGHFTVLKKGVVHVYAYDCNDMIIYTFKKTGRYFCYAKDGRVLIIHNDNDLHA